MSFEVTVTHEAGRTCVVVQGEARLGRLLSLLQVLEVDSASWPQEAVVLDLRQLSGTLPAAERERVATDAALRLRRPVIVLPA
jgi:hypothetical protein